MVAGGKGDNGNRLSSVAEVMNTNTKQWYTGPPTPVARSHMKTAIVGDTSYFMGDQDSNFAYSVCLIEQLDSEENVQDLWKEIVLPNLPTVSGCIWQPSPEQSSFYVLQV